MRPHALVRVIIVVGFLAWVLAGLIPLAHPPKHTRSTDTAAIPPHDVNPRPDMGVLPPAPPLSEAQAIETLRQHGYVDVTSLERQENGDWTAKVSRDAAGEGRVVRIDRTGEVTPQ